MGTWIGPDELKAEANGLKRQPDSIPVPATPGFDEVEGGISDGVVAVVDRANEISAIVDGLSQYGAFDNDAFGYDFDII